MRNRRKEDTGRLEEEGQSNLGRGRRKQEELEGCWRDQSELREVKGTSRKARGSMGSLEEAQGAYSKFKQYAQMSTKPEQYRGISE